MRNDRKKINYDKVKTRNAKKYLILGDMLELGSHSKKLHESLSPIINRTNIDKVFVSGKEISHLYNRISKSNLGPKFFLERNFYNS